MTWTPTITAPNGVWTQQIVVTVELGYAGPLTNIVHVTSLEDASGVYTVTADTPPRASFAAIPTTGLYPLTVAFTDTSTGTITACVWAFGDGLTSTLASPTHIYTSDGVYTVTLTINGPGGTDTFTRTNYITIYTPAHASFSASPTAGIAPQRVVFTNTSTGDYTTCLWNFGDGLTSTLQNPDHTYSSAGNYTVTLAISGLGGSDVLTHPNYITVRRPYLIYLPIIMKAFAR